MTKDNDGNYTDINYSNDFKNWNMFYDVGAGASATIAGAVIIKTIDDTITAEITKSDIISNDLNVKAQNHSIKNIIFA